MKKRTQLFFLFLCMWFFYQPLHELEAAKKPQYLIKFATVAPDGSTWVKQMRVIDKEIREKERRQAWLQDLCRRHCRR